MTKSLSPSLLLPHVREKQSGDIKNADYLPTGQVGFVILSEVSYRVDTSRRDDMFIAQVIDKEGSIHQLADRIWI